MRWVIVFLLLAGCASQTDPNVVTVPSDPELPTQELLLSGSSDVQSPRAIDIMIYVGGELVDLTDYEAEPGAEPSHIRTIQSEETSVRLRLIEDENDILSHTFHPSECATNEMEVIVHLMQNDEEFVFGCT